MAKIKTIALVAPSGDIRNIDEIRKKINTLKIRFNIVKYFDENPQIDSKYAYLADSDENRAKYLLEAFLDSDVDLILPVRGGYGAIRLIEKFDFEKIKNEEKYFAASSDLTIFLAHLYKKTKVKCFHSLMLGNGFVENLEKLDNNIDIIENDKFNLNPIPIFKSNSKKTQGILWGGNLSTIVSMFGNDSYLPEEDIILFIEDLNEPLYKIDKMIYQIYRNKKLKEKIKGIIFGDFYFENNEIMPLLKDFSKMFDVNCFIEKNITHRENNITIPYGKFISLEI